MNGMLTRRLLVACLLASPVLITAGCGSDGAASAGAGGDRVAVGVDSGAKTINVGGWSVRSGPYTSVIDGYYGAQAAFDRANATGGVNGWKINYDAPDSAQDPTRSLQIVRNQIAGKDTFVIGSANGSRPNQVVVPFVQGQRVPYISPLMAGDSLAGEYNRYIFPIIPAYASLAAASAQYAVNELGAKKIALVYEDDAVGQPVHAKFKAAVEASGGSVPVELPFGVEDTDFTPVAQKLAEAKPDAVVFYGVPTGLVKAKQAAMSSGLDVPWFGCWFAADPNTIKLDPEVMDGVYFDYFMEPVWSDSAANTEFLDGMKEYQPKGTPNANSQSGWSSALVLLEALKAITAGGKAPTHEALISELESWGERPVGVLPSVSYSRTAHLGVDAAYILQYKDGEWKTMAGPVKLPTVP